MTDAQFLNVLKESFLIYLKTSARSNEKLKILHGAISADFQVRLGAEYNIRSLGYANGKESNIQGRYINKTVDITILRENKPLAGIAVKFVMSNYSQNSNNYFESMLGETANIRTGGFPYFQIFVIPSMLPYYNKDNEISKWEYITSHNLEKYLTLSQDNFEVFLHSPNKTLVYIVDIKGKKPYDTLRTRDEYKRYFLENDFVVSLAPVDYQFGAAVICNDYATFAEKVTFAIKSI